MSWEKFTKKQTRRTRYDGLYLGKQQLTFTISIYRKIKGERMQVFYDAEQKAIAIKPVKEGGYKMAWQVGMRLHHHMPTGRYLFKEQTKEGYIFIHQP